MADYRQQLPKAAATPTTLLSEKAAFLIGTPQGWSRATHLPVRKIFDHSVLTLFDALSRVILADVAAREYPDLIAFALWIRRSALAGQQATYSDHNIYLGRGVVFHVSPSNMAMMFAYTLAMGLLAGNVNVVRLPSRVFPQADYLLQRLNELLVTPAHCSLSSYVICMRYDRKEVEVTQVLSAACDIRVIWGGDDTIREIRKTPLLPNAFDMVFPDRYSVAVIDSDAWLECKNQDRYIRGFYNDTYLSNQASCSAPRLVLWLGSQVNDARASFWHCLQELVAQRYALAAAQSVAKLEFSYGVLARQPGAKLCAPNLQVTRIWCDRLEPQLVDGHPGGGVFLESCADTIDGLLPLLGRRCQTLSYFGVPLERLVALVGEAGPRGVDRIVPMGHTLDFSLTWDGYDTVRTLSRKLAVVAPGSST